MTDSGTKTKKKPGRKIKVKEFPPSVVPEETPVVTTILTRGVLKADEMFRLVENIRSKIDNEGLDLDSALKCFNLSRRTAPVEVMRAMLSHALRAKNSLFNHITSEERAQFIRNADFEAFMEAVENKDRETQLAYSKTLRTDSQLNMNAVAPSLVVNIGAVKDLLFETLDAGIIDVTPEPIIKDVKIEREE